METYFHHTISRLGLGPKEKEPSILFLGQSLAAFEAVESVLKSLLTCGKRVGIILCTPDTAVRDQLSRRYPSWNVTPPPINIGLAASLFLGRARVRSLVILEDILDHFPSLRKGITKRATPVVKVCGHNGTPSFSQTSFLVFQPDSILDTPQSQKGAAPISQFKSLHKNPKKPEMLTAQGVVDLILSSVGQDRKWMKRQDRKLGRWVGEQIFQLLENPRWRSRLQDRIHRLDTVQALAKRLGFPKTILCLGNGPSSEDPRLTTVNYDSLFRANHSWKNRGFLTQPDVIFTGNQATMRAMKKVILGVPDETTEKVLLMFLGLFAVIRRLEYFVVNKLSKTMEHVDGNPHRPTSGAIMLQTAVALQPDHIIIAGLDMFRHPDGSYPGDQKTMNAYTPAHSYDQELAFILFHLDQHKGRVTILSDILREEWARHCQQKEGCPSRV